MSQFLNIFVCLALLSPVLFAEAQATVPAQPKMVEVEATEVSPFLVDSTGEPTGIYGIPSDSEALIDVLFKVAIAKRYSGYVSWALEFNDPERQLVNRIANVGAIPPSIRWDGAFSKEAVIKPDQKYYYRLLLMMPDETLVASSWSFFQTRLQSKREGAKLVSGSLDILVSPRFSLQGAQIKTKSFSDTQPALLGDIRFLTERHSVGVEYRSTLKNVLKSSAPSATDISYSRIGAAYRYRVMGSLLRAPALPDSDGVAPPVATPEGIGLEIGLELFSSVVRGNGGLAVDAETARSMGGVLVLADAEKMFGSYRVQLGVEGGKSVFNGGMTVIGANLSATYEGFRFLSPGLLFSYQSFSGKPARDPQDNGGSPSVSNTAMFAGALVQIKL